MLFSDISIVTEDFTIAEHQYVGVQDKRITYIGSKAPENAAEFGEEYSGAGKLLSPAFYNLHSHLPMAILRGYGENLPLMEWLNNRIFPFEAHLTEEDIYWGCLAGVAEMLRFGIASTSEMYIKQKPLGRAFLESGVKANFCCSTVLFGDAVYKDSFYYHDMMDCLEAYDGADDGRLHAEFCAHAEYTNTESVLRSLAETAKEHHGTMHVHVSETAGEVAACRERHEGRSPVRFLADCGLFDVPTVAAHCVAVDDEDIAILHEHGVTVATNPKSNLKLASGVAPVARMLAAGVNVGIGTDSVASNNNLNMVEEMRFFNLLQKGICGDPTLITPAQTLYAATRAGALAQQRFDCGLVKEGFRADLVVFDMDQPHLKPVHNQLNNLIYAAQGTDVVLTMVDGRVLYRDGLFASIDLERVNFEVETARVRILDELKHQG